MPVIPDILACPECRSSELAAATDLQPQQAPFDVTEGARCTQCNREFPLVQGVWVMWSDQIRQLQLADRANDDEASQVKQANIQVYDNMAEGYGEHTLRQHLQYIAALKTVAREYMTAPGDPSKSVMVDVGCASGIGLDASAGEFGQVVGVDISLHNLLPLPERGFVAVLADAECLPFRSGSVDLLTCLAAMHHFPNPAAFLASGHDCLRSGGVCMTGGDPSQAALKLGPLARMLFQLRRPVYRALAQVSSRFYLHQDREHQRLNDLAECQRTNGGFAPEQLDEMLNAAGFEVRTVFFGEKPATRSRLAIPYWKTAILKALSFQNPFSEQNVASLSTVSRK